MKNLSYYTLSLSGGKDSLALFLRILDEGIKIDEVVTVDLGDEYEAVYDVLLYVASICLHEKIKFKVLQLDKPFEYYVAEHEVKCNDGSIKQGYGWCGKQRWGTAMKKQLLNNYYQSLEKFVVEYVGIACDELHRVDIEPHKNYTKSYPLIKWKMNESDCLEYCYNKGITWTQSGIRLYDILDRVSCQHCQQKNLKELRNIRKCLPDLWESFKTWQSTIPYPYRSDGATIFDLDRRFELEDQQISMFDFVES